MAGVELRHIGKAFGTTRVLSDIDLAIADGEFVVLVGPSGCGKSTLLRVIAGLEEVDQGDVMIGGERVNDLSPARRGIAMVFQSYALYPNMSVSENLGFGLRLAGRPRAEIAEKVQGAATLLSIDHLLDRRPKMLSGGQRQRVAIGRAIVREPTVFLFDEPLSNLDAELRVRMRYEFAKLHGRLKTTTIYVTHDQVEAMTLADRIAILDRGRIVQVGTPQTLYDEPANMFVAGFIGSPRMNFLGGEVVEARSADVRVRLRDGTEVMAPPVDGGLKRGDAITLGVRPEHLQPVTSGVGASGIGAAVALVESLGNVRFAYLTSEAADEPLVVQLAANDQLREDEPIFVRPAQEHCHLFAADGIAIPRAAPGPGSLAA